MKAMMFGLTLLIVAGAGAQPHYTTYGPGVHSCGRWLAASSPIQANNAQLLQHGLELSWIQGFISAVGWHGENLREVDGGALDAWTTSYCTAHPLDSLSAAAQALVVDLRKP